MWKNFIIYTFIYIVLVGVAALIHFVIATNMNLVTTPAVIYKIYIILGLITLMILQVGCLVKIKKPEFVGFSFMGGMIAKMAFVLALIIVNEEIKSNVLHLISAYFVILLVEVLIFLQLLRR